MYELGYIVGVFVAFIVSFFAIMLFMKFIHKDRKVKNHYDERQEAIRGIGYKYAYFTALACIAIIVFFGRFLNQFISYPIMCFGSLSISIFVFAVYCIFNEAYFALNDKPQSFIILSASVGAVNLVSGIIAITGDDFDFRDPYPSGMLNLICAALFIGIFITLIIKHFIVKGDE